MLCFPAFSFYLPVFIYDIIQAKDYFLLIPTGIGLIRFFPAFLSSAFILVLLMMLSAILSYAFGRISDYKEKLHHILDTSKEHAIMMHERNQALIEKQNADIHAATLSERNRIAREIHDNVGHMLSRSILQTGALLAVCKDTSITPHLSALKDTLNLAMDNIRSSVHDLRDESVDLNAALNELTKQFTFCPVRLQYDMSRQIPKNIKYCFLSITKEAMNNIIKHSNATQVQITVREHPSFYQLLITDNGSVKAPEGMTETATGGMGLQNMRDRVEALHGILHISDQQGYRIFISIPKS